MVVALAGIPETSAHCRIYDSVGDASPGLHGTGSMIYTSTIKFRNYNWQDPDQLDTTVFSDPVIPADNRSPYYKYKRQWLSQGCGVSLLRANSFFTNSKMYQKDFLHRYVPSDPNFWTHRNIFYFMMTPVPPEIHTPTMNQTMFLADHGRIAKVSVGGWIQMGVYQVNDDGAGPFRCRIDATGTGNSFGAWLPEANYLIQPPGAAAYKGVNSPTNYQKHILKVRVPANVQCKAQYGKVSNVCILRCENSAPNGPFGGCIPFQVMYPPKPVVPPPQPTTVVVPPKETPKVEYGDPGYDVGQNNYAEDWNQPDSTKRSIPRKMVKRVPRPVAKSGEM
ncbi:hypothetical protein TWF694_001152 [Orbilia ellipsospora]|uniref:Uncharacterized protein n=1 Tax=Orbilia ellipsospora TaxID=2528407 RepID=A0AAV9XQT7_9PEZI